MNDCVRICEEERKQNNLDE